jgi:16S rRNA (cytidine1402-2'-O)-methyltransferase
VSNDAGSLYIVATPIGNLDDITRRAVAVLGGVDCILAEDTRHSRRLLDHIGVNRPVQALHEHNEHAVVERVLSRLLAGETLALISDAGTPLISDPGYPLVAACRAHGVRVVPVPGASALIAALSVAGLPTDRFRFEGFLKRRSQARTAQLQALAAETATLVFYESSHRIEEALQAMIEVFGVERQAVVARELTKLHETVEGGDLGRLLQRTQEDANQRKGEFVVVVAGAPADDADDADTDRVLRILLEDLPVRQASAIAARITGLARNRLYQRALALVAED